MQRNVNLVDERMLVKEIMTKNVVNIESNKTVFDASILLIDRKIGCLIVMENDFCVGIITKQDIIRGTICVHKDPEKTKVSEIMSSDIKTIHPLDKIEKAVDIMKTHEIKQLPVVANDKIGGIITVTDISRASPEMVNRLMSSGLNLGID